jgi:hypothetical protein
MSGFYNNFHKFAYDHNINFADPNTQLKVLLLRSTGNYTFNPDHKSVSELFSNGAIEISVPSYARQIVTGKNVSVDDVNDRGVFQCNSIQFGTLESGQTVSAVVFYIQITGDNDSHLMLYIDGKTSIVAAAPAVQSTSGLITGATNANPCVITSSNHGLVAGNRVSISSVGGMTQLNGNIYTVGNTNQNTFELQGVNSIGYGTYTSGGTWQLVRRVYVEKLSHSIPAGTPVNFGSGASGTIGIVAPRDQRYIDVVNLLAALSEGAVANGVQTTINLPATLGNGSFNVNPGSSGLLFATSKR